ncbi:MAG: isoprenylcysteine carboxylmethyltransferase family protein [Gammaproteobacteria bacterium]|nr:isoprenylcysteine carboxylmethyltransferase family protein [Gammaproteobacteria bacterium]
MFLRALVAFLAMPGMVAYALPVAWLWRVQGLRLVAPWGLVVLVTGTLGLLWCVRDFYVRGKGTLAPWAPPERLVVAGLYRYSRNPMYISVLLVLLGWAASFASRDLLVYCGLIALAFHLRVVYGEEPWLAQRHGEAWRTYAARVPRWFGS